MRVMSVCCRIIMHGYRIISCACMKCVIILSFVYVDCTPTVASRQAVRARFTAHT